MKRLLYTLLFLPIWANAQVNGTIQKTPATGTVRGNFGSSGLDTLPRVTGILLNGGLLSYNSTTNKWSAVSPSTISPDTTIYRTVANSRSLAQTQTALNLKANLASPTFTGTVTTAALSATSVSSMATNGISGGFTNNSAGFAPLVAVNNGSGNLATFGNSGGTVATIGNTGDITSPSFVGTLTGNASTATTLQTARTIGIVTGDATSSGSSFNGSANNTNSLTVTRVNGVAFSGLATGILKNTTGTGVPSIAVAGTDYLTPTGSGASLTNVVNSITGTTNQVVASASTGAVTLSLPQSIATSSDVRFNSLGLGSAPLFTLDATKSVSSNYIAHLHNTNTTAGTSSGLFVKAGTNGSDVALNVNNAANTINLFQVLGSGNTTIGGGTNDSKFNVFTTGVYGLRMGFAGGTTNFMDGSITTFRSEVGVDRLTLGSSATFAVPVIMPTGSTAVTPSANDNSTKVATTAYVDGGFARLSPAAPQTGSVNVSGLILNSSSTTGNTTLGVNNYMMAMDAVGGSRTVTLPTAVGIAGKIYVIKKVDATANTVTIDADGSETIDGTLTKVLNTQYSGYTIQSNGANWYIIGTF